MTIPALKRVRISSIDQLQDWLRKNCEHPGPVMLVTSLRPESAGFLERDRIAKTLAKHGWTAGPRYTLSEDRLGHVISRTG